MDDDARSARESVAARLAIVDKLRGLMIVLMVLDHVREFLHHDALLYQPTDVSRASVVLFATRWVTHLCAPTFVLLSGVAVYLQRDRGKRGWPLSRFLLARGCWLILLELTVIGFGFNFAWPFVFLQVIWAIGVGMILLAGLTWLPPRVALLLGICIVAGHGLFAGVAPDDGVAGIAWLLAMRPGPVGVLPGFVAYPALPWVGIMAIGYGSGAMWLRVDRNRRLVLVGLALLVSFVLLRLLDGFGDPARWKVQPEAGRTLLSFLNVSKYPPSLLYVLATLGVSMSIAPAVGRIGGPMGRTLRNFGQTPLFTYLAHIYLAHGGAVMIGIAAGYPAPIFTNFLGNPSRLVAAGWGFGLAIVYIVWFAVLLVLVPLSRWFTGIKARRSWWASYL